jgi:hypothetical protein
MRPSTAQPWHSNADAQAVIGLLSSTERLRQSLYEVMAPAKRPATMFSLSYDEVVIGVTTDKHPSPLIEDYLSPGTSARRTAEQQGSAMGGKRRPNDDHVGAAAADVDAAPVK